MKTELQAPPRWLVLAVWITAVLCIGMLVLLAVLSLRQMPQAAQLPTEPAAEAATEAEETLPDAVPEPTMPVLDLRENPYGPEDFDFRGRYLACISGPCKIGVDVSAWQEEITWPLVQAAGIEFAMIRLAWRGNTSGSLQEDETARANLEGAAKAGLAVGGYVFSQAITVEEAIEEAEFVLDMVEGYDITMPIVFDWERSGNRTARLDARTLTDCALAFCQTIEDAGYRAMIYFNTHQAYYDLYLDELKDYGFWFAMYDTVMDFPYRVDMWQYSDLGSVPGISTNVDLNIYFDYA